MVQMNTKKLKELRYNRARMRCRPTKAENQFKNEVLGVFKDKYGIKFKTQKIIYEAKSSGDYKGYILDFYLPAYNLCIEIDGKGHNGAFQKIYDEVRASLLATKGIKTVRFTNDEVFNSNNCIKKLGEILEERKRELKKRGKAFFKTKYMPRGAEPNLQNDREKELEMQAKFIEERGIKILPIIGVKRRFKLHKGF